MTAVMIPGRYDYSEKDRSAFLVFFMGMPLSRCVCGAESRKRESYLFERRGTGNDENKKINDSVADGGCIDRVQSEAE